MLVWNEYDVIESLGVVPEIGEYESEHIFELEKDGLRLVLAIYPYSGDVYLSLYKEGIEFPVFSMKLVNCPGVRYVKHKKEVEYLEFAAAKNFNARYNGDSLISTGVRLAVNPHIRIELF